MSRFRRKIIIWVSAGMVWIDAYFFYFLIFLSSGDRSCSVGEAMEIKARWLVCYYRLAGGQISKIFVQNRRNIIKMQRNERFHHFEFNLSCLLHRRPLYISLHGLHIVDSHFLFSVKWTDTTESLAPWSVSMVRQSHDDVIKWKHFPRYWPFVRGIHQSPVNSPHNGQRRGALMFSLICVW